MARILSVIVLTALVLAQRCPAQGNDLVAQSRNSLARATDFLRSISAEGGYLWRYSADLKTRSGEEVATTTQIWIQSPGTPVMGMTFLRAYEVTKDNRFLDAARVTAEALARGQLESGGWDYLVEFDPQLRGKWKYRLDPPSTQPSPKNVSTYDDDNTQSALRFLMALADADPSNTQLRDTRDYGLKKLLEAQYPIGAWPQRWDGIARDPAKFPVCDATIPTDYPRQQPSGVYYDHYTLNDNTLPDCIMTLLEAHKRTGRQEYLDAAKRGADFLLRAQLPEPQPIWAQQYNSAMQPAWARAFEPPSVTAGESANVLNLLVELHLKLGDERYLKPFPAAIAWFKRSEIAPGRWARMYELTTNRPVYGDRDGKIHYTLAEISQERQTGYRWEGDFGVPAMIQRAEGLMKDGREKWLADHAVKPLSPEQKTARATQLEANVRRIIADQDDQGRWMGGAARGRAGRGIQGPSIDVSRFQANMRALCDYLELVQQ